MEDQARKLEEATKALEAQKVAAAEAKKKKKSGGLLGSVFSLGSSLVPGGNLIKGAIEAVTGGGDD